MQTKRVAKNFDLKLQSNQLIECRGSIWRYLEEKNGFWHLELVRSGAHFSENIVRVWALPQLEKDSIRLLDKEEAYTPFPLTQNNMKKDFYTPYLRVREQHLLQDSASSKVPTTAKLCAIEEKAWQYEPWYRIVDALPFPRLLIADDVGLGKTTEAAIILAELKRRKRAERTLIICPQHLCEKWQTELYERFGMVFEIYSRKTREKLLEAGIKNPWEIVENVIVSRDFLKRWENLKPLRNVTWDMIIIDECHHFVKDQNCANKRLRQLAEEIVYSSPGLLLLSATPFTGKKEQFDSLLELLDPKFKDPTVLQTWAYNNPLMVRRTKKDLKHVGEIFCDRKIIHHDVDIKDLSSAEKALLSQIEHEFSMAKGREDRQHWDSLVEEVARKRLSSSWHAFSETISGEKRLASWFSGKTREMLTHLNNKFDSAKLFKLNQIVQDIHKKEPEAKVVIFTEAIASLEAIQSYLVNKCKYKTSEVASIQSGTSTEARLQIESQFENALSPLRILIATDTISEGKDLQHSCHHLIHFELPWSFVKIEQRNGRIDRLGQKLTPYIHNLVFNTSITPDQKVIVRLLEKIEAAGQAIGSVSQIIESLAEKIELDFINMDAQKVESLIVHAVEDVKSETEKAGFSFKDFTSLSPNIIESVDDSERRLEELKLMMKMVDVSLEPNGKAKDEYILQIPKDWEIRGLDDVTDDLPLEPLDWRVTFSAARYLAYEKHRRQNGVDRKPLHFISPIHPIMQQVQNRFRLQTERGGYPIFLVKGAIAKYIVLAEVSVKSTTSRIISQQMVAIDLEQGKTIDLNSIKNFQAISKPVELPDVKAWQKLQKYLDKISADFTTQVKTNFDKKYMQYAAELNSKTPVQEDLQKVRSQWLQDLWLVDSANTQFHVTALLISDRNGGRS